MFKAQYEHCEDQRKSLEDQLKRALEEKDSLEKEFQQKKDAKERDKRKSDEQNKKEKQEKSELNTLLNENINLKTDLDLANAKCMDFIKKEQELHTLIIQLQTDNDALQTKNIEYSSAHHDINTQINDANEALEKREIELNQLNDLHSELQTEMETLTKKNEIDIKKLKDQLDKEQKQTEFLSNQIGVLKDSTEMGMLQKKIDDKEKEYNDLMSDMNHLVLELESAQTDLEVNKKKCLEYDTRFEDQVTERVASEREQNKRHLARLDSLTNSLKEEREKSNQLELEKDDLVREKEDLEKWNKIYERGHHVQELSKHQKQVKEDNRKLGIAMEQMSRKLSETMDTCTNYQSAFARLKKECGKPPDFMYPEYELQERRSQIMPD